MDFITGLAWVSRRRNFWGRGEYFPAVLKREKEYGSGF